MGRPKIFGEEILATLQMQVGRLGEGDALTHLDGCLVCLDFVFVWEVWGWRREKKGGSRVGELKTF